MNIKETFTESMYQEPLSTVDLCLRIGDLIHGGDFYVSEDTDSEVTLRMSGLRTKHFTDADKLSLFKFRMPCKIDQQWLESIMFIESDDEVKRKYPRFNKRIVAEQLLKYGERNMLIPVRRINFISQETADAQTELRSCNTQIRGFANRTTGEVNVVIDDICMTQYSDYSNTNTFWAVLLHEIRHIGLECNPILYDEELAKEPPVGAYAFCSYAMHDWDESFITYLPAPEPSAADEITSV